MSGIFKPLYLEIITSISNFLALFTMVRITEYLQIHGSENRFKNLKRRHFLGQAVTVGVTMYVLSISELSEVQMVNLDH